MEVRLVGDDELRIIMSGEEMESFGIDAESFGDCDSGRRFRELFERIVSRTGFDPAGDPVSVKLFPGRSGGCELFVSRSPKPRAKKPRERIYSFAGADDFLTFVSLVPREERTAFETLFSGGVCYIKLSSLLGERTERLLEEFALRERGSYLWEYLSSLKCSGEN